MNVSRRYGMYVVPAGAFLAARTVAATRFKRSTQPSASTTFGRSASNCGPRSDALNRAAGLSTENDYQQ
jgi:hypothetical protein